MTREDFSTWYESLPKEDQQIVRGLAVTTVLVQADHSTVEETRQSVYDCFTALKEGE
jgi:hypothetical protein